MKVAIAGATGAVGEEFLKVLENRNFPLDGLRLFASARSAGKMQKYRGKDYVIEDLDSADPKGIDIALFSAGSGITKQYAKRFTDAGAVIVDNSSAYRMDPTVPLVVPEINPQDALTHKGIIANPNCSTIIALVALYPIHKAAKITRFRAATYQAASGAGRAAMDELVDSTKTVIENPAAAITPKYLPKLLAFNCFPQVGNFEDNGYSQEEMKFVKETHKIFHDDSIKISATCVRIPVLRAHSEAIWLETQKPISPDEVRQLLARAPGVKVVDDPSMGTYPMPKDASGGDDVLVGRIRRDLSSENGICLWVSGDQLLKGAALNAVQIAELLV